MNYQTKRVPAWIPVWSCTASSAARRSSEVLSENARIALRSARAAVGAARRARGVALQAGAALKSDSTRVSAADYAAQAAALAVISKSTRARVYAEEPVCDFETASHTVRAAAAQTLGWSEERLVRELRTTSISESSIGEGDGTHAWWIDPVDGSEGYLHDMGWAVGIACTQGVGALALPLKQLVLVADGMDALWIACEDDNIDDIELYNPLPQAPPQRWHFSPAGSEHHVHGLTVPERLCCGSLVKYGEVALGLSQALVQYVPNGVAHAWDHAAGVACVRASGGVVTDINGEYLQFEDSAELHVPSYAFVASANGVKHEEWLYLARKALGIK